MQLLDGITSLRDSILQKLARKSLSVRGIGGIDDITEGARTPLKSVNELQIVEITDDDVVREYKVPVRIVKDVRALMD